MALLLSSKGKIQDDLKQIAIDRINYADENAYSNLDDISKRKIENKKHINVNPTTINTH